MKKVRDFMRSDVFFVRPNFSVFEVAKVFSKNNISGAPVVDKSKVIGMVSISDIVKFMSLKLSSTEVIIHDPNSLSLLLINVAKMGKDYTDFKREVERISKTKIKDMMSSTVVSIGPDADLFEAANAMDKYDVNRLPVIEEGRLIGIITRADLIKALVE